MSLVVETHRCSPVSAGLDGSPREGEAEIFPTPSTYRALLNRVAKLVAQGASGDAGQLL